MLLGIESFSYHMAFCLGRMDVFGFIRRAAELGLDGVQINIGVANSGRWGHLGDADPGRLREVRECIEGMGLFVEVDTCLLTADRNASASCRARGG